MRGYTLIELLVVIAIIAILAVIGIVNYKSFSSDQIVVKAQNDVQTYLRLTQSNASSSTFCSDNQNVGPWSLTFRAISGVYNTIDLSCGSTTKTYTLESAKVSSIIGIDCGSDVTSEATSPSFKISFSSGIGAATFSYTGVGATTTCLASASWTFTVTNTKDSTKFKTFKLSKGGAIDVQ